MPYRRRFVGARVVRRKPDGEIRIDLAGANLVNREALAKLLHVTPLTISGWTKLPDGLPYIRPPSVDPKRQGLRMLFDVDVTVAWLKNYSTTPNPTRKLHQPKPVRLPANA